MGLQTFSTEGQMVNVFGFVGHTVSLTTMQRCCVMQKQPQTIGKRMSVLGANKTFFMDTES